MNIQNQIKYWLDSAENDCPVAESLFNNGHYAWCLFIGHLLLEKLLKAIYVRDNQKIPPRTHDLVKLTKSTKLELTKNQEEFLFIVNDFNLEARYPDEKLEFYKLCTKKFARKNFEKIKVMYQWLKSQITS